MGKREKNLEKARLIKEFLEQRNIYFEYEENSYKFTIITLNGEIEYWASSGKWHFKGEDNYQVSSIKEVIEANWL